MAFWRRHEGQLKFANPDGGRTPALLPAGLGRHSHKERLPEWTTTRQHFQLAIWLCHNFFNWSVAYIGSSGNIVNNWNGISMADQGGGTYTAAFSAANVPQVGTYTFTVTATKSGLTLLAEHDIVVQLFQI